MVYYTAHVNIPYSSISGYVGYIMYIYRYVWHCKGHYGHRKSIQTNTLPVWWDEATIFDANQFRRTYPHWGQLIFFAALCVTPHHSSGWFNWAKVNEHLHETILCLFPLKYGNKNLQFIPIFSHEISGKKIFRPATIQTVGTPPV